MGSLAPREHFPHLEDVVYLNSGSIGLMPLPVQEAAAAFEHGHARVRRAEIDADCLCHLGYLPPSEKI